MSNFTVNDIDRKLLREQIKRKMLTEARKNLAQKVIEERYEKGITAISVFDIFDKSEIKNIVEFAQNNLDEVKLAAKVLREQVYSGQLTNSENKVNQVLSSDVELKGQKIKLHEVSDFALDMLFGFGPMLGMIPLPGFELAGSGIAIAGLLYYGYKLYQAIRADDGLEIFIQGISVLFAAAAVFPKVGAFFAAAAKKIFDFFKGFIGFLARALLAVKTMGGSLLAKGAAKVGEEVIEKGTKEALKEVGEKIATNSETLKKGADIAADGAKYLDNAIDLLKGMKEGAAAKYLGKIPVVGSKLSSIIDNLLEVLPKVRDVIIKNTKGLSEVAEVAVKEGVDEVGTGALTTVAAATTAAEKKAAQETLEALARHDETLAAAAQQLGYLDEAFEATAALTTKGASGVSGIYKTGEAGLSQLSQLVSGMAASAGKIGKGISVKVTEEIEEQVFKGLGKLGRAGIENKTIYQSATNIYKGLMQGTFDLANLTKSSIAKTLKNMSQLERTIEIGLSTGGKAYTKGLQKVVVQEMFEKEGKMFVKVVAENGREYTKQVTSQVGKELVEKEIMKKVTSDISKNIARKQAAVTSRMTQVASQGAKEVTEEVVEQTAAPVLKELSEEVTEEIVERAATDPNRLAMFCNPEALALWPRSGRILGGFWNTFASGLDVSGKTKVSRLTDTPSSDYYNIPRSELREALKNKSLKYLY